MQFNSPEWKLEGKEWSIIKFPIIKAFLCYDKNPSFPFEGLCYISSVKTFNNFNNFLSYTLRSICVFFFYINGGRVSHSILGRFGIHYNLQASVSQVLGLQNYPLFLLYKYFLSFVVTF